MRRVFAVTLGVALVLSLGLTACKKKEQQPVPQAPGMMPPGGAMPPGQMPPGGAMPPGQMPPGGMMPPGQMPPGGAMPPGKMPPAHGGAVPKVEMKIVVPDSVKGKWSGVVLIVEDKSTKKKQEFKVNLNSDLKIPNSNLKVAVGDFLPSFKMDGSTITSTSNDTANPAVRVKVFEGDKEIFKGWLYSKFPAIHPFDHPKYGLGLKEGIKKG
jgi:hypothetical protein